MCAQKTLQNDTVAGSRRFEGGLKKVSGKLNAAVRICQNRRGAVVDGALITLITLGDSFCRETNCSLHWNICSERYKPPQPQLVPASEIQFGLNYEEKHFAIVSDRSSPQTFTSSQRLKLKLISFVFGRENTSLKVRKKKGSDLPFPKSQQQLR